MLHDEKYVPRSVGLLGVPQRKRLSDYRDTYCALRTLVEDVFHRAPHTGRDFDCTLRGFLLLFPYVALARRRSCTQSQEAGGKTRFGADA